MAEVMVVGAGLAGLTAAINCAKQGHRVTVLEKYNHIGGVPYSHPAVDITPMDPQILGETIGIALNSPQVTPAEFMFAHVYDKRYQIPGEAFHLYAVERGERPSSLDIYLYGVAKKEGVKFEFGKEINKKNFSELPPNSIISTGLDPELFENLNLPCKWVYGYVAKGECDETPRGGIWFNRYTRDYFYYASANGINFGLCFDRKPMSGTVKEQWHRQLLEQEGVEFSTWHKHEGIVPIKVPNNPRFFWKDKILAGTFAGVQDPVLLFGVHGALLSGKIAALAVDDKAKALGLFRQSTSFFKYSWLVKKAAFDLQPHLTRKIITRALTGLWARKPGAPKSSINFVLGTIPGFKTIGKQYPLIKQLTEQLSGGAEVSRM